MKPIRFLLGTAAGTIALTVLLGWTMPARAVQACNCGEYKFNSCEVTCTSQCETGGCCNWSIKRCISGVD